MKLDGEPLRPTALDLAPGELDGKVLQAGKRRFRRLRFEPRLGKPPPAALYSRVLLGLALAWPMREERRVPPQRRSGL